ncbi:hypothetical protein FB559_3352 [Actinoallomurus bryophytorum]|uniref:Uncharacterized protein n=1 Tax=Actinoallomurus bryophytorum TaxID=1490222 RepID=A0A543CKZ2_9ACTN|nr:hypothetical protein FB559_3352 [Actinoallomurus bryophytorum]
MSTVVVYCGASTIHAVQRATILLLRPPEWNLPVNRNCNSYV